MAFRSVIATVIMATVLGTVAIHAEETECPSSAVYPYWSICFNPAVYEYAGGVYQLVVAGGMYQGQALAPEWDESNSTYYVRLASQGAKYAFTHLTEEYRLFVTQQKMLIIKNVDTGRMLSWRQEGDEYFLVEEETIAYFEFIQDEDVSLPCPRISDARCEGYNIITYNTSSGLTAYEEDDVTYLKQASDGLLPFLLIRQSNTSYNSSPTKLANTAAQ